MMSLVFHLWLSNNCELVFQRVQHQRRLWGASSARADVPLRETPLQNRHPPTGHRLHSSPAWDPRTLGHHGPTHLHREVPEGRNEDRGQRGLEHLRPDGEAGMDQLGPAGGGSSQEGDPGKPLFLGHSASLPRRHGHGSRHGHGRRDPKHDPPKSSLPPPPSRANPSSPPPSPPRDVGGPSHAMTEMIQNLISKLKSKCDQLRQSKLCFSLAQSQRQRVTQNRLCF